MCRIYLFPTQRFFQLTHKLISLGSYSNDQECQHSSVFLIGVKYCLVQYWNDSRNYISKFNLLSMWTVTKKVYPKCETESKSSQRASSIWTTSRFYSWYASKMICRIFYLNNFFKFEKLFSSMKSSITKRVTRVFFFILVLNFL